MQCPVHRQPRAKFLFSCALSGGSPDIYCALSGVHRTATVDCPVCPSRVLKNRPQPDRARGSVSFLLPGCALSSLSLAIPSARRRPPTPAASISGGLHLRRPAHPSCFPSVSSPLSSPSDSFLSQLGKNTPFANLFQICEFL